MVDLSLLLIVVLAALALKHRYGTAGAEELVWLLAPTTSLVELVTGQPFVHEAGAGFVGQTLPLVIAPGCAGLNFFVIALLTLSFGFIPKISSLNGKAAWLAVSPLFAYAATIVANAIRITSAIAMHETGFRAPLLTPAEAHRALGVVVYLPCLWILFACMDGLWGPSRRAPTTP